MRAGAGCRARRRSRTFRPRAAILDPEFGGEPMNQTGGPSQPNQPRPQAQHPAGSTAQPGSEEIIFEGVARHMASAWGYIKWSLVSIAGGVGAYLLGLIGEPSSSW